MNFIKKLFFATLLLVSANVFAKGGDDSGNGGFAYAQSIKILKMATAALEEKIKDSTLKDIVDFPERRVILQNTLEYDKLRKLYFWNRYRDNKLLAMDYDVNPPRVTILKAYYVAFSGSSIDENELKKASLEVQRRLLHEASHIWGYKEEAAEKFSIAFLKNSDEDPPRPSDAITLKAACSCRDGKSDTTNQCDAFCAVQPISTSPFLYVDTIIGSEIANHPKLKNLYNWCTVQLSNDSSVPKCVLSASDGVSLVNLNINLLPNSNRFTANISQLTPKRTWTIRLEELESKAQSSELNIQRLSTFPQDQQGILGVSPINQYTCMTFGGKVDSAGNIIRTNFSRVFYYYLDYSTPAPIEPPGGNNQSLVVCHDEILHPGEDNAFYERLELVKKTVTLWDLSEPRFIKNSNGEMMVNEIIKTRLLEEYGLQTNINLFTLMSYQNRPSTNSNTTTNPPLGFVMIPFSSPTGKAYCPTSEDFAGTQPLFTLLGDYMTDTEGLYIGEGNGETVRDGAGYKTIYSTMFVREAILKDYGFYTQDGFKIKANKDDLHKSTIYYYWPVSPYVDPLVANGRRLFTIKRPSELNGQVPTGQPMTTTSDKRIGCIPKN